MPRKVAVISPTITLERYWKAGVLDRRRTGRCPIGGARSAHQISYCFTVFVSPSVSLADVSLAEMAPKPAGPGRRRKPSQAFENKLPPWLALLSPISLSE